MHKLVIFDCDGVLVDSETISNGVISANLARYGLAVSVEECMALFVGGTMLSAMDRAQAMGADLPVHWVDEIYAEIHAELERGVPLVPGIVPLLDHLDEIETPYCVASNGSEDKMRITLGQNGLWERFEKAMFSAYRVGVAKPYPGLFLAAARHFGVDPGDCVVIEDSVNGATAAARANMRCLAYTPHSDGAALRATGAETFTDMRQVPQLMREIEANRVHSA